MKWRFKKRFTEQLLPMDRMPLGIKKYNFHLSKTPLQFKNAYNYLYISFGSIKRAPNNDLRPESLQTCKDNIYINVFDEIVVDVLEVINKS